jgi:hypothetical protein
MTDAIHDATTQGLIDENPVQVRYQPRQRKAVPGGAWKWVDEGSLLAEQQGRIVYRGNVGDQDRRTLPDGRVVVVQATIVHLSGAEADSGWIAHAGDERWEVVRVIRHFDVRAEVVRYAST